MPCLLVLDNAPTAAVRHKTLCDALQKMLGTAVGVAYDANGKPSLTGYPPLRYLSVTTTGDYMVAALPAARSASTASGGTALPAFGKAASLPWRNGFSHPRTMRLSAATLAASAKSGCGARRTSSIPVPASANFLRSRSATETSCCPRFAGFLSVRWPFRWRIRATICSPSPAGKHNNFVMKSGRLEPSAVCLSECAAMYG